MFVHPTNYKTTSIPFLKQFIRKKLWTIEKPTIALLRLSPFLQS